MKRLPVVVLNFLGFPLSVVPMKYRRFGRTNIQMPVFSTGGMRYQHQWTDVPWSEVPAAGQKNLEATIARSLELGIHHIETARGYGSSEMQLGPVLRSYSREKLIVQTKVPPFADPRDFLKTFEVSMNYLGLDYVDLLSLHGINNRELLDWSLRSGGCVEAARQLQREGRAKHIGFSTHGTPQIVLDAVESDAFDYVNLHWYFVNDLNWASIEAASRRDMGVFIISPNDKGGKLYLDLPKMRSLCQPLTPMQFNDLYCLARPQVHTLSLGAACPTDYDEHIAALAWYDEAESVTRPVADRLEAEIQRVVGSDWWEQWHKDLPDFDAVPGEVNVMEILRIWTYAKPLELLEWAKFRYNMLGTADHWFPGEHVAKLNPDKVRSVLGDNPLSGRILDVLQEAHKMFHDAPVKRLSQS